VEAELLEPRKDGRRARVDPRLDAVAHRRARLGHGALAEMQHRRHPAVLLALHRDPHHAVRKAAPVAIDRLLLDKGYRVEDRRPSVAARRVDERAAHPRDERAIEQVVGRADQKIGFAHLRASSEQRSGEPVGKGGAEVDEANLKLRAQAHLGERGPDERAARAEHKHDLVDAAVVQLPQDVREDRLACERLEHLWLEV